MSTKCRNILFFICGLCIITILCMGYYILKIGGVIQPYFCLKGEPQLQISYQDTYQEAGYIARTMFVNRQDEVQIKKMKISQNEYQIQYHFQNQQLTRNVQVIDDVKPKITLVGASEVVLLEGEAYHEQGYQAMDEVDGNITNQVKIKKQIQNKDYQIIYEVEDQAHNKTQIIRKIKVVANPMHQTLHYQHDAYDNTYEEWWFEKSKNHQQNKGARTKDFLQQYQAYYQGKKEKVLYLTFDEGGNDVTYIKEIAKLLDKHQVKASFFLTANYLRSEAKWVKTMVKNGHDIVNHTAHHKDMTKLAHAGRIKEFVSEIKSWEKDYLKIIGKKAKPYFRFPKGGFSERSLKMVSDLGYKSIFWSHAYYDYGEDISKEEALKSLLEHVHPGAIYLIHPSNRGNYEAIEDFIIDMHKQGYRFALLDDLVSS